MRILFRDFVAFWLLSMGYGGWGWDGIGCGLSRSLLLALGRV